MKLSKRQQELVDLMKSDWQLGKSMGFSGRYWLQKGGCGKGGESKDVNANTAYALYKAGLIAVDVEKWPLRTYKLT